MIEFPSSQPAERALTCNVTTSLTQSSNRNLSECQPVHRIIRNKYKTSHLSKVKYNDVNYIIFMTFSANLDR